VNDVRIAVCVKWVPDPENPTPIGPDSAGLERDDLVHVASPVDLVACEAGMRVKEAVGGTVALYTAGPAAAEAGLRGALALGCDEAARVAFDAGGLNGGVRVARLLAAAVAAAGAPDLVLCGTRSPDSGSGVVPAALAELLGLPYVGGVVRIEPGNEEIEIERRLDGGRREVLRAKPGLVVGVEPSLCQPRYPALLARRKAERTPIAVHTADDLGVADAAGPLQPAGLHPPRPRLAQLVAPPPSFSARERLSFILEGGGAQCRTPSRLAGSGPSIVDELLKFLEASGVAAVRNGVGVSA
jgi:electron transfer flavoprotein beta subunit